MSRHVRFRLAFLPLSVIIIFQFAAFAVVATAAPSVRPSQYDAALRSVPTPHSVLGFTPGDDRTIADWRQITDYFTRLDRASDRVMVETIGRTTLGRPLIAAFISAPDNIRDLAKYKEIARRLADPRTVTGAAERDRLLREGRAIVVVSCSIHSTEIVASQMAMQLAYELAHAADTETKEILQQTITILIPSSNPDGVDIVADWYRRTLGTPYEGSDPPEIYHHYAGHDNNRDWFMLNLRETQALTRLLWREWFPQIVYDVHQQGATGSRFFVPPFYDPANPYIAPLLLREVGLLGHKIAADLQAADYQGVITGALYDTWWHGGFRTAPYYHNSIGILSEAASARLMSPVTVTRGQLAETSVRGMPSALAAATNFPDPWPGGVWHPRDVLKMELIAARAVLTQAAKYRAQYLHNFYGLGVRALNPTQHEVAAQPAAYVIAAPAKGDEFKREALAKMIGALVAQGVEVHRTERELHAVYTDRQTEGARAIATGSYLILTAQPFRADVQALFEKQSYPERLAPDGTVERPYDVTGWTLPLQMGVSCASLAKIIEPAGARKLTLLRDETEVRRDLNLRASIDIDGRKKSPLVYPLARKVRVGIYRGWTNSIDEGWTRFVFDEFNIPYDTLRDEDLRRARQSGADAADALARYDAIVLPSQRDREIVAGRAPGTYPAEYTGGITEAGAERLRAFVLAGGTLICFDAATEFAIKRFDLPVRNALENIKTSEFYCPGSILRLRVENDRENANLSASFVDAYFINSRAFDVLDRARARVIASYAERDLLQSGWLLGAKYLSGKAALVEAQYGRGRVILFGFRPQHRGQTWATYPFVFRALETSARATSR